MADEVAKDDQHEELLELGLARGRVSTSSSWTVIP